MSESEDALKALEAKVTLLETAAEESVKKIKELEKENVDLKTLVTEYVQKEEAALTDRVHALAKRVNSLS